MTGKQGFKGNLSSGEIINQVLSVEESASLTKRRLYGYGRAARQCDERTEEHLRPNLYVGLRLVA